MEAHNLYDWRENLCRRDFQNSGEECSVRLATMVKTAAAPPAQPLIMSFFKKQASAGESATPMSPKGAPASSPSTLASTAKTPRAADCQSVKSTVKKVRPHSFW
jgi:hypothetical protein